MLIEICREYQDNKATLGTLRIGGTEFCKTLELPWKANAENVSCIPEGSYVVKRINSPHFGNVWNITEINGRTNVLIHKGNWMKDTHGCVLLGLAIGDDNNSILSSEAAFDKFMEITKDETELTLSIHG